MRNNGLGEKFRSTVKKSLELLRRGSQKNIPSNDKLDISLYKTFISPSVSADKKSELLIIQLTEELVKSVFEVQYYDVQGFLGQFKQFENYRIERNVLIIDLSMMPPIGQLLILLSTNKEIIVVSHSDSNFFVGDWEVTKNDENALMIISKSQKQIRPINQQIFVKNVLIDEDNLIVTIPNIEIDDIIMVDELEARSIPVEYKVSNGILKICVHVKERERYRIFVIRNGIQYRLFYPKSLLDQKFDRYYKTCHENQYFYFSEYGYLKFAFLNNKQLYNLYKSRFIEVTNAIIQNDEIKLNLSDQLPLSNNERIVARRYEDIVNFDHFVSDETLTIKIRPDSVQMARGFSYGVQIACTLNNQTVYIPFKLKKLHTFNRYTKKLELKNLEISGDPFIEFIDWRDLNVKVVLTDKKVSLQSLEDGAKIEQVLARYKERPVFSDISGGISLDKLRTNYQLVRIIYRRDGLLTGTNLYVSDLVTKLNSEEEH